MLAGLTSRWMRPWAWAASSASATWRRMASARSPSRPAQALEQGGQVAAVDVAHDQVEQPVALPGGVDRDDAGVLEARRQAGLAEEALAEPLVPRQLGEQHLDGHPAVEPDVERRVDRAHRPVADDRLDPVPGHRDALAQIGHGPKLVLSVHAVKTEGARFSSFSAFCLCSSRSGGDRRKRANALRTAAHAGLGVPSARSSPL